MHIFGFSTNYIPVKTIQLTRLICPRCQDRGLMEMTILQEEQDGVVIQRLDKLSARVQCKSCHQAIPQKEWTPEITAAFKTEKANIKVATSVKLSRQGKRVIAIFAGCIVFIAGIFAANALGFLKHSGKQAYEIAGENTELYITNPAAGDICQVGIFDAHRSGNNAGKYTLFKIVKIDKANNKMVIIPHTGQVASPNDFAALSTASGSFNAAAEETFLLKEFSYHHFRKENEGAGDITRNIYSIKRPGK